MKTNNSRQMVCRRIECGSAIERSMNRNEHDGQQVGQPDADKAAVFGRSMVSGFVECQSFIRPPCPRGLPWTLGGLRARPVQSIFLKGPIWRSSMKFTLHTLPLNPSELSAWSQFPDIEDVTDFLSPSDVEFMSAVGQVLVDVRQTARFAVTLLHSHFQVNRDEVLVEMVSTDEHQIITEVFPVGILQRGTTQQLQPKSWCFAECCEPHEPEPLQVLTWARREFLRGEILRPTDSLLIKRLATVFRKYDKTKRFGMALVGVAPNPGFVWSEGPDQATRRLIQDQLESTNPRIPIAIKTMWQFDETGRRVITLGCCRRTRDGKSHTGAVHPPGW
jgi:hypothetical protein